MRSCRNRQHSQLECCSKRRHHAYETSQTAKSQVEGRSCDSTIFNRSVSQTGPKFGTKKPPPIREAAIASLKAPLRPVPVPVDPTDASEELQASGLRGILEYGSRKTSARPARSSELSGDPWRRSVSKRADLVNYRNSRCDRIGRIGEDETTICPRPCIRRNLFRLAWPRG